jgi:phosphoserine phosphatase
MTKLLLTRHGHVEGIHPARFRGSAEIELTTLGTRQAVALADRIASTWSPSVVYTSPLTRCVATGRAVAMACQVEQLVLEGLNDLDYGEWQWKTHDEVRRSSPDLYELWRTAPQLMRFPGGESLQALVSRVSDALHYLLKNHPGDTVALVTHDSASRALLLQLLDQPLSAYWRLMQSPCALSEIDIEDSRITVARVNETAHVESLRP